MYNVEVNISVVKSKLYVITLLTFLALFFYAPVVSAEQINLNNIPAVDAVKFMPDEEFQDKTKPFIYESDANKDLEYTMRLPKEWTESNVFSSIPTDALALERNVLGTVSYFTSPPYPIEEESFLSVEAMTLTYEIGVQNWFINYALINGLSLERMTVKHKKELEVIYIEVRKDTTYIVRARAMINGSKIIIVRYYVAQPNFNKEKLMQAQIINSFKLTSPDDSPIEELQTFGFLSQSYIDYPPSWKLEKPNIISIDRMKAKLHRNAVADKLEGQIDIRLVNKLSASSRKDIIREFRKDFSIDKYKVDKYIESPEIEYHKDMSFGVTQSYQLNPTVSNMVEYELWVSVMEGEDYYYLISLITPSRGEEFYKWARNIETYKLVVQNLRRHDKSKRLFEFID